VGFWLDRFELVFSPRGIVFGASYTDVHASLPILGGLAVLALLAAVGCLVQIARPGLRVVAGAVIALGIAWVVGLASTRPPPAVPGHPKRARRRAAVHRVQRPNDPAGLRSGPGRREGLSGGRDLDARALERNAATVKNIRLWDYRPLLRTYAQLQEIRTYYKFVDVDNDRYLIDGEYRQLMLSPRELSYAHLPSRIWINEHLTTRTATARSSGR